MWLFIFGVFSLVSRLIGSVVYLGAYGTYWLTSKESNDENKVNIYYVTVVENILGKYVEFCEKSVQIHTKARFDVVSRV